VSEERHNFAHAIVDGVISKAFAAEVGNEVIELLRSDARKERVARRGIELLEGVPIALEVLEDFVATFSMYLSIAAFSISSPVLAMAFGSGRGRGTGSARFVLIFAPIWNSPGTSR
jgi:hypothetical protein